MLVQMASRERESHLDSCATSHTSGLFHDWRFPTIETFSSPKCRHRQQCFSANIQTVSLLFNHKNNNSNNLSSLTFHPAMQLTQDAKRAKWKSYLLQISKLGPHYKNTKKAPSQPLCYSSQPFFKESLRQTFHNIILRNATLKNSTTHSFGASMQARV